VRNACEVLVADVEGKIAFGRYRHKRDDNIEI
jgi:hypothetical protein